MRLGQIQCNGRSEWKRARLGGRSPAGPDNLSTVHMNRRRHINDDFPNRCRIVAMFERGGPPPSKLQRLAWKDEMKLLEQLAQSSVKSCFARLEEPAGEHVLRSIT
jgi:hypothetical protein